MDSKKGILLGIFVLLAAILMFLHYDFLLGYSIFGISSGFGFGTGSGTGTGYVKQDRCLEPGATQCGSGNGDCCLDGEFCYKGKVCCDSETEKGEKDFGIYYCKKKCNKGELKCGETCCNLTTEKCVLQGVGKHGTCMPKDFITCEMDQTPCRVEGSGDVAECCEKNEICISRKIKAKGVFSIFNAVAPTVYGCTATNCAEGETLVKGTKDFTGYNICCSGKASVNLNGLPYCIDDKKKTLKSTLNEEPSKKSIFEILFG